MPTLSLWIQRTGVAPPPRGAFRSDYRIFHLTLSWTMMEQELGLDPWGQKRPTGVAAFPGFIRTGIRLTTSPGCSCTRGRMSSLHHLHHLPHQTATRSTTIHACAIPLLPRRHLPCRLERLLRPRKLLPTIDNTPSSPRATPHRRRTAPVLPTEPLKHTNNAASTTPEQLLCRL